jgi:regulatory NSL complex subunit 3
LGAGAIVAATVSLTERVAGVICLGFPLYGTFGRRGESNDPLLQVKHPILFIIGGRAANNRFELITFTLL